MGRGRPRDSTEKVVTSSYISLAELNGKLANNSSPHFFIDSELGLLKCLLHIVQDLTHILSTFLHQCVDI